MAYTYQNHKIDVERCFKAFLFATYILFIDDVVAQSKNEEIHQNTLASALAFPKGSKLRLGNNQGTINFLHAKNLTKNLEEDIEFRALQDEDEPPKIALAFIRAYKKQFGLLDPKNELILNSVNLDDLGYKQIRFHQIYLNIPVWNAEILVQLDQANHVVLVQGQYVKTPVGINTQPNLREKQIFEIVADQFEIDRTCKNCKLQTVIYAPQDKAPRLAFQVSVTISLVEGWIVTVDADTGSVLNKISTVYSRSLGGK